MYGTLHRFTKLSGGAHHRHLSNSAYYRRQPVVTDNEFSNLATVLKAKDYKNEQYARAVLSLTKTYLKAGHKHLPLGTSLKPKAHYQNTART